MQEFSWGCSLAIKTIKSIITSGRCNAARKRNKELAAIGTPALHGRPPKTRVPQVDALLAQKRAMPQAMPDTVAERRFTKRPRHGLHSTVEPGADAAASEAAEMVMNLKSCGRR